jgi:4-hydroxy-tetrahydrodipicolinate synthase
VTASAGPDAIGRVITALATPFLPDGTLDLAGCGRAGPPRRRLGSDGLVVGGTTGESPTLRDEELWDLVGRGPRRGRRPGTHHRRDGDERHEPLRGAHRPGDRARRGRRARRHALLQPAVAGRARRALHGRRGGDRPPGLLYDIPSRTGREIDVETLVTLSRVPNIIGVKDATARVRTRPPTSCSRPAALPAGSTCGRADEVNLPLLSVGAVGVVSVAAHLAGPEIAEMVAVHATDPVRARELHLACMPLHRALFLDPNPGPLKAALRARGLPAGPVRLPLVDAGPDVEARVVDALSALEARSPPSA